MRSIQNLPNPRGDGPAARTRSQTNPNSTQMAVTPSFNGGHQLNVYQETNLTPQYVTINGQTYPFQNSFLPYGGPGSNIRGGAVCPVAPIGQLSIPALITYSDGTSQNVQVAVGQFYLPTPSNP